jgi:DnaK suppressor protein
VRIFKEVREPGDDYGRLVLIATHVKRQLGGFSTDPNHIASEKISSVERGAGYLLKLLSRVGPQTTQWAQTMLQQRGIEGVRVLQGLLSMTRRYTADDLEKACRLALSHGALLGGLRDVEQEEVWNVLDGADAMDAASESAVNDIEACLGELRAVELMEIDDAFQKLFDGTYGTCEECGKRIPETRIKLIPAVSLCVACKRDRERLTESRGELPEWSGEEVMADVDKSEAFCGQARRRF